jgi:ABC-type multidrug transport system fused ATPase/permease subunit
LSFKVNPKERIAIVGQSGTGKTTIADLLLNIYHPEKGDIFIDKMTTTNYRQKQITPRFAIVSQ